MMGSALPLIETMISESKDRISAKKSALFQEPAHTIYAKIIMDSFPDNCREMPYPLVIPHKIFKEDNGDEICLFVRSSDEELAMNHFKKFPVAYLGETMSLDQVLKEQSQYRDRKQLVKRYSHFFCDDRIKRHLYASLGKIFYQRNKLPIPLHFPSEISEFNQIIEKARDSMTFVTFHNREHAKGPRVLQIKIGHTDSPPNEINENLQAVITGVRGIISDLAIRKATVVPFNDDDDDDVVEHATAVTPSTITCVQLQIQQFKPVSVWDNRVPVVEEEEEEVKAVLTTQKVKRKRRETDNSAKTRARLN